MKKCPVCGHDNKDNNKFCVKCGEKFAEYSIQEGGPFEIVDPEKTELIHDDHIFDLAFENEKTTIIRDEDDLIEYDETVIIDDVDDVDAFENDETVIIDDQQETSAFEDEETVIIDDQDSSEDEKTTIICDTEKKDEVEKPTKAPDFKYEGAVPVYRDPQNDVENETAYIDHLRRLKGLLDDGIINEWEFEQKKKQILGLEQ